MGCDLIVSFLDSKYTDGKTILSNFIFLGFLFGNQTGCDGCKLSLAHYGPIMVFNWKKISC